jgi:hypothetical protein
MGLNPANFIGNVLAAETVMGGLRAFAEGVESVFRRMDESIGRASGLEQLSKRTGETVGTLYQLQEGFKAVGLSADSIPMTLLRLQNSLAGVNEMGESTGNMFARLGLDRRSLEGMDAVGQINAITSALERLPKAQATGMAQQIFGRFGAGDVLQIARSGDAWRDAITNAQKYSSLMERLAPLAEKYKQTLHYITMEWDLIWDQVALNILPVMQRLLERVKELDVSKFIQQLDKVGKGISGAIIEGHVEELLQDSLAAAWEQGKYYGERVFFSLAAFFGDALEGVLSVVFVNMGTMLATAIGDGFWAGQQKIASRNDQGKIEELQNVKEQRASGTLDPRNPWAQTSDAEIDQQIAKIQQDISVKNGTIDNLMAQMVDSADRNFEESLPKIAASLKKGAIDLEAEWDKTAGGKPHAALDKFFADVDKWSASAAAFIPPPNTDKPTDGLSPSGHYKPEFTSLEKMGFVMTGEGNPMREQVDLLRLIETNTRQNHTRMESGWLIQPVNEV